MAGNMNGNGVTLNDAQFQTVLSDMRASVSNMDNLISSLDTITKNLRENWQGSVQGAYDEAYIAVKNRMLLPMRNLLDSYVATLEDAKNNVNYNDNANANNIQNTFGGVKGVGFGG